MVKSSNPFIKELLKTLALTEKEPELADVIVVPLQQAVIAYLDAVIGSLNEIVASATASRGSIRDDAGDVSLDCAEGVDSTLIDREVELLATRVDMLETDACRK